MPQSEEQLSEAEPLGPVQASSVHLKSESSFPHQISKMEKSPWHMPHLCQESSGEVSCQCQLCPPRWYSRLQACQWDGNFLAFSMRRVS
uniref:Uncharacterized protein n=1 Tax=Saimiri boliviensis boliviensis TaxID=39432 RepID=A0A2K6V2L0_SAIBB